MSALGHSERATQDRVIALFRDELGYRWLGNWSDRPDNHNIDEPQLTAHLTQAGYFTSSAAAGLVTIASLSAPGPQAGGLAAISRWLRSAATTPPDPRPKMTSIPEGCQVTGIVPGESPHRCFGAPNPAHHATTPSGVDGHRRPLIRGWRSCLAQPPLMAGIPPG